MFANRMTKIKRLLVKPLSIEEAVELSTYMLGSLGALPFHDIIAIEGNDLIVNGEIIDFDKARLLRESALNALQNSALRLVHEQTAFVAVTNGIHKAETPAQILFARAALWQGQQEKNFLEILAGRQELALGED